MSPLFETIVMSAAAAFFALTAIAAAAQPAAFAQHLGLSILNAGGANEIRSQYAGFFTAAGLACGATLAGYLPRSATALLLVVIFGGLIFGRLASLLLNRGPAGFGATILALYAIDATGFALSLKMLVQPAA